MKIGIVCSGSNPVPPINYGGTQMVNWETAEGLIEYGHEVTLFAPEGSKSNAKIVNIKKGWGEENEQSNLETYVWSYIDKLDVFIDTTAFGLLGRTWVDVPYIARMGGDQEKKYCKNFNRNIVFPSRHHASFHSQNDCACGKKREERRKKLGNKPADWYAIVVPKPVCYRYMTSDYKFLPLHERSLVKRLKESEDSYYLYLGLIASHKGTHLAVEFAEKTGVNLIIAGPKDLSPYFDEKIAPRLTDKIQYAGPVDNEKKWKIMAEAKAVIFSSICEEGDPNVPKESLLVGTPVLGLDGTVVEIVTDGVTGVICKTIDELADRYTAINYIDPEACRRSIIGKFSRERYINQTLGVLRWAIKGERWI